MIVKLVIPGSPIPLQRSRTSSGRHYLPARSKTYRLVVQAMWMQAGRPSLGDAPFAVSMRFYGARANADLDNLIKAILDALNGLAYTDDRQLRCIAGAHTLPVDAEGPRAEIDLWPAGQLNLERAS
ncbi:MAG: RusA family crossover junction endodeoxyribonuclease [Solirubrobacteraceae bacterium]